MHKTPPKSLNDICSEWDGVCEKRQIAIEQGQDVSLSLVTAPCIVKNVREAAPNAILDVGCGTGYVTSLLAQEAAICCGIDASQHSIDLAKDRYSLPNLQFFHSKLSEFSSCTQFDLCVSNMVLNCSPDLRGDLRGIYKLLPSGGIFLAMIPHPCFWPLYWGFQNEPWFHYQEEMFIEHDFSISLVKAMGKSTYIHRPLSQYIQEIVSIGFSLKGIEEPYPVGPVPRGYSYSYPRFLFLKCRKDI